MIYAEAAEKGTIGGKPNGSSNPSAERERWRVNKRKALMDSLFYTFALSTINNYKSALDFNKKAKEDEQTIMKLQKNVKEAKVAREDYAAGAEINRYATKQLLTIVDADAQSLQSEIIRDLQTISYD